MKTLIVVDMQNDFITGPLGTPEAVAIVPKVKEKIEEAVQNGDLIIYTRDTHSDDYLNTREGKKLPVEHCLRGTYGWMIPDELMPPADYDKYRVVNKYTFGNLKLPRFLLAAAESYCGNDAVVEEIEIVGLVADICVVSNAIILKAAFYETATVFIDGSCTAGTNVVNYQSAINVMRSCQIEVI